MKKILTLLILATMLTGCGHVADSVKHEVAEEVQETKNEVTQTVNQVTGQSTPVDAKFSIGGVAPGMSIDEVKKILGEPTSIHDGDEYTFANGLQVDVDTFGGVEEVKTYQQGVQTAAGVAVGMTEQNLIAAYGQPAQRESDDGAIEYKYISGDGRIKIKFNIANGTIIEIKSSIRD